MLYYLYWVIFFAFIYMILGADFNVGEKADDYKSMTQIEINFIGVFRNSLGDISIPGISYWLTRKEINGDAIWASFFIHAIWIIILLNTVLTLIVLLNFLIAIVSESYNRMNRMQVKFNYLRKAELNRETILIIHNFMKVCSCCFQKQKSHEIFVIEQELFQRPEDFDLATKIINQVEEDISDFSENVEKRFDQQERKINLMQEEISTIHQKIDRLLLS